MFNHHRPARKLFVICFLPFAQVMLLACLCLNETVCMICFYPKIPKISVKRYRIADICSPSVFIYLEIMFTAFGLLYIYDFKTVPLDYNLGFQRMAFFSPNNTLLGLFSTCL
jgi:hypothetical protein